VRCKPGQVLFLLLFILVLVLPSAACQGGDAGSTIAFAYNSVREWFILQWAGDRIEKMRKGDAAVTIVDDNGVPVRQARVYFQQQKHDFLFGSNLTPLSRSPIGPGGVDRDWADAYIALFNYGTLPFYWDSYEPVKDQTAEKALKAMADWATSKNITVKGHALIWTEAVPPWAPPSAEQMQTVLEKRVKDTVSSFCGIVDYWDVVNEPTSGAPLNNPVGNWMNKETPSTACSDALEWARSACPKAILLINDYRTDQDFKDLLQNILRQRGRFDAIGIQSQMQRGNWPLYQVWDICERFKDFNVPIHFSEVSILSGAPRTGIGNADQSADWPSTAAGEAAQAEYAGKFYTLLFSHPSVQAITWWDFSDEGAWQGAPSGLLRKDMSKKPAYDRLLALVRTKWWSVGNAYTGDDGRAVFRGFFGQYRLIVEKEGKRVEADVYLARGLENKFQVQLKDYQQPPMTPFLQTAWPYIAAAAVVVLAGFIINWVIKIRRRI